ncbi:MAG: ATP-binding protein [Myxococcota bacterium]|nr:ATP-binding protein [Myxococcota bacterium]
MRWSEPPAGDPHRDVTGALHDVSNALTVLLGWIAEAHSARDSADQLERALAIIEDRARTARDLARRAIGAHITVADREESLDAVIDDVIEALSVEAQRVGVAVTVGARAPGVRIPLAGDASQILTNVVLNALAWAPRNSQVSVEAHADLSSAGIVVQDEGPGVPPAQASRIFEGSKGREGGAGVGLRHARALARAAGGDLELMPPQTGCGASFRLRWPRIEHVVPIAPLSAPRPPVLAGTRLLLVEDDGHVATLLEAALGARGAEVVVARTASELALQSSSRFDAALVDLSPIAHDVQGAIDALRRGSPDALIVFISGSAVGLPEGLTDDNVRWVRKPFEVGEIVVVLAEARAPPTSTSGGRSGQV